MRESEVATQKANALLAKLQGKSLEPKKKSDYVYVNWHKYNWMVKISTTTEGKTYCWQRRFADEDVAAWAADVAAILMKGADAFELPIHKQHLGHRSAQNFPWKHGIPGCPDNKLTVFKVAEWLDEKGIPLKCRPSQLAEIAKAWLQSQP